ncbi:hypothetical protein [Arenibacter sp. F20364]|uniref:hypothetical protein n=1 Tax=Arenibacter sp. F20364 TaxID=2926415 RepID=UPI001FF2A1F6|nr:hypothetical protein [Arenibacter sp. F20364]MCK0192856.1 hypothetical protein [Arenibacter sp. F20364]
MPSFCFFCNKCSTLDREGWILYRHWVGKEDETGGMSVTIKLSTYLFTSKAKGAGYPSRHPDKKVGMPPSPAWGRSSMSYPSQGVRKVLKTLQETVQKRMPLQ